ncbi:hypothetical protein SBY92_000507 [Candida maltosa Xu316]
MSIRKLVRIQRS